LFNAISNLGKEQKLQDFLNSGLLEKYVSGETSVAENKTVETYIAQYPSIQEEYEILQDQLELTARAQAINPSSKVLDAVMQAVDESKVVPLHQKKTRLPHWLSIAASIAAVAFALTSYVLYNKNQILVDENNTIADEIFDLRNDIDNNNELLNDVMKKLGKLDNPETQKYLIKGNERAKDLKAVAYINAEEKSSLIDIVSLPELSDEQCYQMWAQIQDKMVNLGILDSADRNLKAVPYIEDALSLSITIEPKGGNANASLENEVAEIPLKSNNEN